MIKYNLHALFFVVILFFIAAHALFVITPFSCGVITFVKSNGSMQEAPNANEMQLVQIKMQFTAVLERHLFLVSLMTFP